MVRIWCCDFSQLKFPRDVGEHYEGQSIRTALISIHLGEKGGYQNHPQVTRFIGHEGMLIDRHEQQVREFCRRGYPSGFNHKTPISPLFLKLFKPEPYTYTQEEEARDLAILKERGGLLVA